MSFSGNLFRSFLQGGFECSSHRRRDGRRIDMISQSGHDVFAAQDYGALAQLGLRTIRDGVRWHLVENRPGQYDFSSFSPMLEASLSADVEVIWDLFHYGWPDDIDIFSPDFIGRFANFTQSVCRVLKTHGLTQPFLCPVNEISFVSWAGGDVAYINPLAKNRGFELKSQLVQATLAAVDAIRGVLPEARIIHCEPAIHIIADPARPQDIEAAEAYRLFQFQGLDMLSGRICPELGGGPQYMDLIGLNYYNNNQWIHNGTTIWLGDRLYRPLHEIVREYHGRYGCPMFIAETGCEGDDRPLWFHYVAGEVQTSILGGVPLAGLCLYPVANHPGWDDERPCPNGLLGFADDHGNRPVYEPLARELTRQQAIFSALLNSEREAVA